MRRRFGILVLGAAALGACSDDGKQSPVLDGGNQLDGAVPVTGDAATSSDAGSAPASDAGTPSDCFQNPSTYLEILNACTDAEKVVKKPSLPLLMVDGGLPPLP